MSPYSANRSVISSSLASSWMFVAITIQPSILRTATAFSPVLASPLEDDLFLVGEVVPLSFSSAGGFGSISISVDIVSGAGANVYVCGGRLASGTDQNCKLS